MEAEQKHCKDKNILNSLAAKKLKKYLRKICALQ